MKKVIIRKAREKDLPTIIDLAIELEKHHQKLCKGKYYELKKERNLKKEFEKFYSKEFKKKNSYYLVAEKEKQVIGFLLFEIIKRFPSYKEKEDGFIVDLMVEKNSRKKGIGKKLLKETEKTLKKKKIKFICLNAWTCNKQAIKAYKKMGFNQVSIKMVKEIK